MDDYSNSGAVLGSYADPTAMALAQQRATDLWNRKEAVNVVLQAHGGRDQLSVETLLKEAAQVLAWLSATGGETIAPN